MVSGNFYESNRLFRAQPSSVNKHMNSTSSNMQVVGFPREYNTRGYVLAVVMPSVVHYCRTE